MKTKFFVRVALTLCVMFIALNCAKAQQTLVKRDTLATVLITSTANVNQVVSNAFKNTFKNAVEPRWFVYDKTCLVKFLINEQRNQALYDKKGRLIYHISRIDENTLPDDTKGQITNAYPGSKILNAYCVTQNNRNIFVIDISYGKNIVFTRFADDELVEVDRLTDASAM